MNNYELARLIVDDVMKKVNGNEQVFYQEYVRGVEALLNKHAAQQSVQADECPTCAGLGFVNDDRGRRGVDCSDCNGSGIRH